MARCQTQRGHQPCLRSELGWGAARRALLRAPGSGSETLRPLSLEATKRTVEKNQTLIESQKSVLVILCLFGIQERQSFSALAAVCV